MYDRSAKTLCRDCCTWLPPAPTGKAPERCRNCGSLRLVSHVELDRLSLAHIDCDAFYATVEKRDNPELLDKPVIIGGGKRGVVSAACYVARVYGVRSAMPMFKALAACPHATVIRPNMSKYSAVGSEVRTLMREVTPMVEPLSIDEAFLDLSGTERLHKAPAAETLARLVKRIETEIGITASIGLSYNKFLAKVASDLDKPRGFFVIGEDEASTFLKDQPVSILWGVGKALQKTLITDGISTVGDLQPFEERELMRRYGSIGQRLARFSHGIDGRTVDPSEGMKSVSAETTFDDDRREFERLSPTLWKLSEEVSDRLKAKSIGGSTVTLKLKTKDFKQLTRQRALPDPTQLSDVIYRTAEHILQEQIDGRAFRLIGVGISNLVDARFCDPGDLADPNADKRKRVESAIDDVRKRLGSEAIGKGRGFGIKARRQSPPDKPKPQEPE